MKKQVAFLFGSGISFPSQMPSVSQITDAALDEEWHLSADGRFMRGPNPSNHDHDVVTPVVKAFLSSVRDCAADYLSDLARPDASRKPHYEDLFSLTEQVLRCETDHTPNLAVAEFLRKLRQRTASLYCGFNGDSVGGVGFVGLAISACNFLHWVVHDKLQTGDKTRRGLELISKVASVVDSLDIFTLNHDLLIEQQLKADGIDDVESGFDDHSQGKFAAYRPGWWEDTSQPRKKVRLIKLHGSLNYWRYEFENGATRYAMPDGDAFHTKDHNGKLVMPSEWKAAFLSGTVVKELHYGGELWSELFASFRSLLASHTHLICCGYGFGDAGINQRLINWVYARADRANRLVIMTQNDPNNYLLDKPTWLSRLREQDRLVFVSSYLEDCPIAEIEPFFHLLGSIRTTCPGP